MSRSVTELETYINTFDVAALREALAAGNKDAYRNGILPLFQAILEYLPYQTWIKRLNATKRKYTDDGALPVQAEFQGEIFIHLMQTVIPNYVCSKGALCGYFNGLFEKILKTKTFKEYRPGGVHYPNEKQYLKYKNFIKLYQSKHPEDAAEVTSPAVVTLISKNTGLTEAQCAEFADPHYGKSAIYDTQTDAESNEYSLIEKDVTLNDDFLAKLDEYRAELSVINVAFKKTDPKDKLFLSKLLTAKLWNLIGKLDEQSETSSAYDFIDKTMLSRCLTDDTPSTKDIETEMRRPKISGTKLLKKFNENCKKY